MENGYFQLRNKYENCSLGSEPEANAVDPVLNLIELDMRRKTLLAEPVTRDGSAVYRFNIHRQGENETVFFDI